MKRLPKSIRKYIQKRKAEIRREFLNVDDQKKEIDKLYLYYATQK